MSYEILFFSRGRGGGHAVPDMAIAKALAGACPSVEIKWVSYGTGADILRRNGYSVFDLEIPDTAVCSPYRAVQAMSLFQGRLPKMVIAHEEFAAVSVAVEAGVSNVVCIADFFLPGGSLWMQWAAKAGTFLFIDAPGTFVEPECLPGKVVYTGPFCRRLPALTGEEARRELGVEPDVSIVAFLPGMFYDTFTWPVFYKVYQAFQRLQVHKKTLICASSVLDVDKLGDSRVVRARDGDVDKLMIACDVAVTRGTRKTNIELASLGKPAVVLSPGTNPIDDKRMLSLENVVFIRDPAALSQALQSQLVRGAYPKLPANGLAVAVAKLVSLVGEENGKS